VYFWYLLQCIGKVLYCFVTIRLVQVRLPLFLMGLEKRLPFRRGVLNTGLGRSVDRVRPVGGLLPAPYGLAGVVAGVGGSSFFKVSSSSLPVTFSLFWV